MSKPVIKDLRYVEKLPGKHKAVAKREQNKRAWRRQKIKKEMEEKKKELKRWGEYRTIAEQYKDYQNWANAQMTIFVRNSGRHIKLSLTHKVMTKHNLKVLEVVKETTNRVGWIHLQPAPEGRHPLLNQGHLRKICKELRVPYYREMSTNQQRAALLILADYDGIDPRRDLFEI